MYVWKLLTRNINGKGFNIIIGNKYRYIESRMGTIAKDTNETLTEIVQTIKTEDGEFMYTKEYEHSAYAAGTYGDFFIINEPSLKLIRTKYFQFNIDINEIIK